MTRASTRPVMIGSVGEVVVLVFWRSLNTNHITPPFATNHAPSWDALAHSLHPIPPRYLLAGMWWV